MYRMQLATVWNPILRWLWEHGLEEIIGPEGPVVRAAANATRVSDPDPAPWRSAVAQLVQAAQAKELAGKLPGPQRATLTRNADAAIDAILEDWCGTPPRRHPWPWPGPPPWVWEMASELSLAANTFAAGALREQLTEISGKLVARATDGLARG